MKSAISQCLAALLAPLLAGCASIGAPVYRPMILLDDVDRAAIQDGVRSALKDPSSAMFGDFYAGGDASGAMLVCGYVNARNSFGGYTGMTPFAGAYSREAHIFQVSSMGGSNSESLAVIAACRHQGVPLP